MPSHIYIAPWEWVAPPDRRPHWQAPGGGALGALDLRSQPQYSQPGPVPEGCGLFVYPQETRIPGGYYLGSDPQRQLTVLDRSALEAFLGVRVAETQLLRTLRELLLVHADPTGQDRWKGVVLDSRRRMRLVLGAFGQLIDEAVGVGHPCLDLTLAVRWADYRRNREDGLPLAVLQRWTGYDMLRVYGRMGDDLLPALVPPEYQADGWRSPRTVFTDTFVDTNGTGINVHTPTPDGGFAWVYGPRDSGATIDIQDNRARHHVTGAYVTAKLDTALSGADHQVSSILAPVADTYAELGVILRTPQTAGTETWYAPMLEDSDHVRAIWKASAGSWSLLVQSAFTVNQQDYAFVGKVDGSTISLTVDGGNLLENTDGSPITGNLYTGIGFFATSASNKFRRDDFEARDLEAPTGFAHSQAVIIA